MATMGYPPQDDMLARLGGVLGDNKMGLLGAAAQLLGGNGFAGAGQGLMMGSRLDQGNRVLKKEEAEKKQKKEEEAARKAALEQALGKDAVARMGLDNATEYYKTMELYRNQPKEPKTPEETFGAFTLGPDGKTHGQYSSRGRFYPMKEGGGVTINTGGEKAPTGYRFSENGDLTPIKGGPADPAVRNDQPMPAEVAGRMGLADVYRKDFPSIVQAIDKGTMTGPYDQAKTYFGIGEQADVVRKIQGGKEALIRALTGAGQSESEAKASAAQYDPAFGDSAATLKSKASKLMERLDAAEARIMQGRGGAPPPSAAGPSGKADPLGIR